MKNRHFTTILKNVATLFLILFAVGLLVTVAAAIMVTATMVQPTVETAPMPNSGDAADDACIWIHPMDPSLSTIIGADKQGGMGIYNLNGSEFQYIPGTEPNNVDIRYNFPLGGDWVAVVCFGDRNDNSIGVYKVNPATRSLENVEARNLEIGISVYGFCMYYSSASGKYYCFINSDNGEVEQWEIFDNGSGKVDAALVRTFAVGSITEGCVADDLLGHFYISEERVAIWKYGAEPNAGASRTKVDDIAGGRLHADIEGLTIYYDGNQNGYLIASSQGLNEYVVYERQGNNRYVMTFQIVTGNGIDAVSNTDGIDVINFSLGSLFPSGLFIAQDGVNDNGNQNFKLVPWQAIANSISPALKINTTWDPRQVGAVNQSAPAILSFLPISGQVGTEVTITGIHFTGATAVVFNGTPATSFTVDSDTRIRAVVPAAAASGKISVITSAGTAASTVDFTVIQLVAPNAPTQLSANAISSTAIELAWNNASDNEDGFKIERRTTGAFAEIATLGPNTTGFSDNGLAAGTTYTYRVRAFNSAGNSGYSNEASATPQNALVAPNSPAQLSANTISSTIIELAWNDNADNEDGFQIERRTTGAFAEIATIGPNVTGFSDNGLSAGTTYTYRVRAFNNIGSSNYSNEASATTTQGGGTGLPITFELKPAYPNPFNSQTTIQFALSEPQNVELQIFNSLGQIVRTLSDGISHAADNHFYQWDGRTDEGLPAPTGIYYVRLNAGPMHATRKLSLIKN
ncbi:phytase [candidate division KSB1 bacterium]|nr:phytase [candidate division KSB1 bacterium]